MHSIQTTLRIGELIAVSALLTSAWAVAQDRSIRLDEEDAAIVAARDDAQQRTRWHDPTTIAGHDKCARCHKMEIRAWQHSAHGDAAFDRLRTSANAREYADALLIEPESVAKNSLCVNCHGTQQQMAMSLPAVIPGVSCESCHGGADGEDGWLNGHAVYGRGITDRERESFQHYQIRRTRSQRAGQLRSSDLYSLVRRCFDCHVIGDSVLQEAGHDQGEGFEVVRYAMGQVRHNFVLNPGRNAEVSSLWTDPHWNGPHRDASGRMRVMMLVGQFVDLETSLLTLARATEDSGLTDAMIDRIDNAQRFLRGRVIERVGQAAANPAFQQVNEVLQIASPIQQALAEQGFLLSAREDYRGAAQRIATVAKSFSKRDGNELKALDRLALFAEEFLGEPYQP